MMDITLMSIKEWESPASKEIKKLSGQMKDQNISLKKMVNLIYWVEIM